MDNIDTFIEVRTARQPLSVSRALPLLPPLLCSGPLTLPPLCFAESVCAGRRRGLGGEEERVPGPGDAAGGPHRQAHPTHAQHHPGEAPACVAPLPPLGPL